MPSFPSDTTTEAQLRETQKRLELSLKSANLGTWTYRVAIDDFWADDRALTLHGHAPGEAKTFVEAGMNIHPDDYEQSQATFAAALQTRSNLQMEYRVIWRNGSIHWIASYAEFDAVNGGTFYGIVQDITEAKRRETDRLQTETALRETEARLRVLIQNLPGGAVFVVDRNLRYLLAEGEALSIAGFKPEDLVGRTISEVMPPELISHHERLYRQALSGEPFEHEHHAHDRYYVSRGTPLRAENGEVYAVLAVSYDISDRKSAEIALAYSRRQFEKIAATTPDLVYVFDLIEERNIYVNAGIQQVLGYSEAQIATLGASLIGNLIHPDDIPGVIEGNQRFRDLGDHEVYDHELRMRHATGEYRWLRCRDAVFERTADGTVTQIIGTAQDITEQKRAEVTLRESEARLQQIANLVPDLLWDSEPDGSTNWYNQRWLEYTGQTFNQAIGSGWSDAIHPDDREESARHYREAVEQGISLRQEHRIRRQDGVYRWFVVKASPLKDKSGRVIKMYGAATDIHEQRVALEALRESEAKYRSLFESIDEGFLLCEVIVDENEEPIDILYLEANPAAIRLAGRDFSGQRMREIDPNYEDYWYELIGHVALTGESVRAEHYAEPHGRWFDFYASKIGGPESRRVASIFQDTTDRKQREQQQAFLLKLSDALRTEPNADAVANRALQMLIEQLQLDRSYITSYYLADNRADLNYQIGNDTVPPLPDHFVLSDFPEALNATREGTLVIEDDWERQGLSEAEQRNSRNLGMRAMVAATLRKDENQPLWSMVAMSSRLRRWTSAEIALVEEVAERTWAAVERAKAEQHLCESEEKYRSLFTTMDQGFCIIEKVETAIDEPSDFRYLTVNPAFERHTGMHHVVGRTIRELIPDAEQGAMDIYDEVVQTGQPRQFEDYISALDRWLAVEIFPAEQPDQIAVLFSDISERKQAEVQLRRAAEMDGFRLELSDALRSLSDAVEIQRTASRIIGEYLEADRVYYVDIEPDNEHWVIVDNYVREGAPPLIGRGRIDDFGWAGKELLAGRMVCISDVNTDPNLSESARAEFRAVGVAALLAISLIKAGRWAASFALQHLTPREWSEAEIKLLQETAERTWAAVERAKAEQSLRTSEEKYRSLFTSIDEGFTLLEMIPDESGDPADFRIVETNPVWEQQTGLTDAVGKTLLEVVPNFEQPLLDFYSDVLISGRGRRTEYYTASVDRWYTVFASRIGGEESRQVAVVFNDITDRKQREREQEFLLKLSDAIRSLDDAEAVWLTAAQVLGRFLGACRVAYAEDGGDGETFVAFPNYVDGVPDVVGRYRYEDFGSDMEAELRAGRARVQSDVAADVRLSAAERQAFAAMGIGASINVPLVKNGRLVAFIGINYSTAHDFPPHEVEIIREVSERTWAAIERARAETAVRESELQRVREQSEREQERQRAEALAELDRAKTLFFSNVSHEFRTPLTLLLAPLQEVLNDRTLSPTNQERLELAHRNSLRLLKLVNALLDFSRIEAGRMEAVYEPIDLAQLTTELASVFRSAIERAGLRLVVDCPSLPESVYVDREMWEKIILNLLSNAFKFTFAGEITVRLQSENHCAIVQIEDTGTGIAPEHLPHLFERFYQVRGAQARTHEGSGIGLALVHELVRLQGGTIEVTSTVGAGTCFTIAIPFGTDHLPSDRLQDEGDRPNLASTAMNAVSYVEEAERWLSTEDAEEPNTSAIAARVLLVDDNADMREYLTRILSEHVQVEAVADGMTALRIAQAQVPDLILSDVMMPELDGFGLLQALRSDPRTREIPIILLSARAGEEAIVEGLEAGADDYLIKPFSAQELVSRVNAHLQIAQLRTTALQEARSTIQNRDELLSTVSHELNTPLVSILGWTRLLRSNPPSPSILNKALNTIERNATLQAALVQDLLDISRITAGKLRLNAQPVELKSIVEIAIATVTQTAEAKSIDLVWQPDQDALVMGDRDRLQQVLSNVLTNAIKFTPAGGRVTVELSRSLDQAEIRVMDTGIGIASDFLPHVFDRFRQARTSDAAKGLGVGLAIARHLVELHQGTIRAESAGEGQGATFVICLPLVEQSSGS